MFIAMRVVTFYVRRLSNISYCGFGLGLGLSQSVWVAVTEYYT